MSADRVPWSRRCEARDCEQAHTQIAPLGAYRYRVCDHHAAEFVMASLEATRP